MLLTRIRNCFTTTRQTGSLRDPRVHHHGDQEARDGGEEAQQHQCSQSHLSFAALLEMFFQTALRFALLFVVTFILWSDISQTSIALFARAADVVTPPVFPTSAVFDASNSSVDVRIGNGTTCFWGVVVIFNNVSDLDSVTNETTYRQEANATVTVVPTTCGDASRVVRVLAIVPVSPCDLVWLTNISDANYTTHVVVNRRSDVLLPIANTSLDFYDSAGSIDVYRNVPGMQVPLHKDTQFYWSIESLPESSRCGLPINATTLNTSLVSLPSSATTAGAQLAAGMGVRWDTMCPVEATLYTNTTHHPFDPYYSFASVRIRSKLCVVTIAHASVYFLGAVEADVVNLTVPDDLPPSSRVTAQIVISQPSVVTITPAQYILGRAADASLSRTGRVQANQIFPYVTLNASLGGTPSRCVTRVNSPTFFQVSNRSYVSVSLIREQFYFANATFSFNVAAEYLVTDRVDIVCSAPAVTISPAVLGPGMGFTSVLKCTTRTNGTVVFGFEIARQFTQWRKYAIMPTTITVPSVRRPIGVNVDMFDPAVLLFGEQSSLDASNTMYVAPSRGSEISSFIVVTLSVSSSLNVSESVLTWSAGAYARKPVIVSTIGEGPRGNITITVASFDSFGRPTSETAGSMVFPSNRIDISINSKAPVFSRWEPAWDELTQGRPLSIVYSVVAPPIGELRITPSGPALSYVSIVPSEFIINSSQTTARAVVTPLRPTLSGAVLLTANLSGTAARQFLDDSSSGLSVKVRPQLKIESSMTQSHLSNAGESFSFYLQEMPLPGTRLTMSITCLLNGISQMIFSPSFVQWTHDSEPVLWVRSMATSDTGPGGVNCTGALGGNATGYEPFLRNIVVRHPQPLLFTFQSSRAYPGEMAFVTINTQFVVAYPIEIHVSCQWIPDNITGSSGTRGYDEPLPQDTDPRSCNRYVVDRVITAKRDDLASIVVSAYVRVPEGLDRERSVNVTLTLITNTTDVVLPTTNMTSGILRMRPRRWIRITELPDTVFRGDMTSVIVTIESPPDNTEKLYVKIGENPSLEWDRNSVLVRNLTLIMPASSAALPVNISATSASQVNRYATLNNSLDINLHDKIFLSTTRVYSEQVVGDANSQSFDVSFSRAPLLRGCDLTPSFKSASVSLVVFNPPILFWGVGETTLTKTITVIGVAPGVASQLIVTPDCNPREVDLASRVVVVGTDYAVIPLKTIAITSYDANLTRIIAGEGNQKLIVIRLSSAPSARSSLSIKLSFSEESIATIEPSTLFFAPGAREHIVTLFGVQKGSGQIMAEVLEGIEYVSMIGSFPITVIDPISVNVFLKGTSADGFARINSDTWSDWEISVSDFISNFSPTFEVTAYAIDPTVQTFRMLSTDRISISSPPVAYPFRLAAVSFVSTTIVLNVRPPSRSEFKPLNAFNIAVAPVPSLNISGIPTVLTIGARNVRKAHVGVFVAPEGVLEALLDVSKCNASVAVIKDDSVLKWTPEVFGNVPISFEGRGEGLCEVAIYKYSTIFGNQIVYHRRQFQVFMPPVVSPVNSTNSVQALRYTESTIGSIFDSVSGGSGGAGGTGGTSHSEQYTGGERGENITFPFKVLREEVGTIGVESVNGTFPVNNTWLRVAVMNEGSGAEVANADIVVECQKPRETEVGLAEVIGGGTQAVLARIVNPHLLELSFGPMPDLLIMADQKITVRFLASAFVENAFPLEAKEGFPVILQRYQPNIVTNVDRIITQVAGNLATIAAMFGTSVAVTTSTQFYQSTWLYNCPHDANARLELPFGIEIERYDRAGGVDNAVVVCACFVACSLVFGGFHSILVSGFYLQRREDSQRTFLELAGRFRYPSVSIVSFYYVVQYATHFAMLAVFSSENIGHRVAAFIVVGVPVVLIAIVIHGVVWRGQSLTFLPSDVVFRDRIEKKRRKNAEQRRIIDGSGGGAGGGERFNRDGTVKEDGPTFIERVQMAFRPKGYWVHPTDASYVNRWGMLFMDFSGTYKWLGLIYFVASVALGGLSGFQPASNMACVGRTAAIAVVYGLLAAAVFFWRPFQYGVVSFFLFVVHAMQFVAHTILAAEVRADVRNDTLQLGSLRTLIAADVILLLAMFLRAVLGCFHKPPPREDLVRTCEEIGVRTEQPDFSEVHLRAEDGTALAQRNMMLMSPGKGKSAPEDPSLFKKNNSGKVNFHDNDTDGGAGGDDDDELFGGRYVANKSKGVSNNNKGRSLQRPLLSAPTLDGDDPLLSEAAIFASGYPHHEDPDLYGQYAPVFVADRLRGDEEAFSPMRRAQLQERQRLARQRFGEEHASMRFGTTGGAAGGRGIELVSTDADASAWLEDVAPIVANHVPLSSVRVPHSKAHKRAQYDTTTDYGGGNQFLGHTGGGDVEMTERTAAGAPSSAHYHNPHSREAANARRMVEKSFDQHTGRKMNLY